MEHDDRKDVRTRNAPTSRTFVFIPL
jgi:hypothetical protein